MKKKQQTKETKKKIDMPPALIVFLFILAIAIGVFFIVKDASNVNSAYSMVKNLYTLMFN